MDGLAGAVRVQVYRLETGVVMVQARIVTGRVGVTPVSLRSVVCGGRAVASVGNHGGSAIGRRWWPR
jgi:hypothetical protein